MGRLATLLLVAALAGLTSGYGTPELAQTAPRFAPDEIALAASLKLPEPLVAPADPSNRYADNPRAADLGKALFFDVRLSANGSTSCASCHRPELAFSDAARFSKGLGTAQRNTPTLVGSAWSRWYFWDGRSDSHWGQALGPLLHPDEQGLTRTALAHRIRTHYRQQYESLFGPFPRLGMNLHAGPESGDAAEATWRRMPAVQRQAVERILANVAKAIAAYERTLVPEPTRFDRFAAALAAGRQQEARSLLSRDEIQGFRLFVGSARCIQCHNGPMLSNYQFHNTGLHEADRPSHMGHRAGVQLARASDFSCLGRHSDDTRHCPSRFVGLLQDMNAGTFKTPTLRNLALTAPYMHTGEFSTLDEVIAHYDQGGRSNGRPGVIGNELVRLGLSELERRQLKAFLLTLSPPQPEAGGGT
ncbi:MAG: hypothetical protein LDL19_04335 [Thiobacillus sp.]|nr:hypothetical protein [Thiobacillus sp.]